METHPEDLLGNTVDKPEIDHFNRLAPRWWKRKSVLHTMNELRVPFIQNGISSSSSDVSKPFKSNCILEVGCAGGILTEELAKLGCSVHAIDPCSSMIAQAKEHAGFIDQLSNLEYSVDTIEEHALHNFEKYDAVIASEVVEHITDKEAFLEACIKCVKPGGKIFITTFNKTTSSWLFSIILIQDILNIIPRGTHTWDKFISPEDVSKMLEKFNCKTTEVKGMSLNCVTKSWSWTSSLLNSYALQAVKLK